MAQLCLTLNHTLQKISKNVIYIHIFILLNCRVTVILLVLNQAFHRLTSWKVMCGKNYLLVFLVFVSGCLYLCMLTTLKRWPGCEINCQRQFCTFLSLSLFSFWEMWVIFQNQLNSSSRKGQFQGMDINVIFLLWTHVHSCVGRRKNSGEEKFSGKKVRTNVFADSFQIC